MQHGAQSKLELSSLREPYRAPTSARVRSIGVLLALLVLIPGTVEGSTLADLLIFRELTHESLGNASLTLVGTPETGELVVGSIGSAGLEGVAARLPDVCFYSARWGALPPHQDGDLLRFRIFDEQEAPAGSVSFDAVAGVLDLNVELPQDPAFLNQMRVYDASSVVYSGLIADSGTIATVERWPDEMFVESICTDIVITAVGLAWDSPVLFSIPGEPPVFASWVFIASEAFSGSFRRAHIEVAGIPELVLLDVQHGFAGGAADEAPGRRTALEQNRPNPFNPNTEIEYSVARATHVRLEVFDLAGRHVRTLVNETRSPGVHREPWDARDEQGRRVASGVYLYRLIAGEFNATRRMVLLK